MKYIGEKRRTQSALMKWAGSSTPLLTTWVMARTLIFSFFFFIFISWRLITLQYGTLIFELVLARDWQTFSEKAQIVNILGFALHTITITLTQLCHCSAKTALDNTWMNGRRCAPIKIFLIKRAGQIWPRSHSLFTPYRPQNTSKTKQKWIQHDNLSLKI